MVTYEHVKMLQRLQKKLSNVSKEMPYEYVTQCFMDAELLTDVIELVKEDAVF